MITWADQIPRLTLAQKPRVFANLTAVEILVGDQLSAIEIATAQGTVQAEIDDGFVAISATP